MALASYSDLLTAVADWLARADLAARAPDFISLGQARLNRDLRVRQMQGLSLGTDSGGIIDLPSDLLEIQSLSTFTAGAAQEIHPLAPERLTGRELLTACVGYVVIGDNAYLVGGAGDQAYTLLYKAKLPAIGDDTSGLPTTNWLLDSQPGAYLYAALIEASPYCGDDQRVIAWGTQYKDIVNTLNSIDERATYGNAPRMMGMRCAP